MTPENGEETESLPTRGAWIEMIVTFYVVPDAFEVAPHAGSVDRNSANEVK